jgi:hypothetical protein
VALLKLNPESAPVVVPFKKLAIWYVVVPPEAAVVVVLEQAIP